MSESSSESYSNSNSQRYSSTSRNTESPSNESYAYNPPSLTKDVTSSTMNLTKAKKMLKDTEDSLIKKARNHSCDTSQISLLQNHLRDLVVDNENMLIQSPTHSNLLTCYTNGQPCYDATIHNIFIEGLKELADIERKNSSSLKYW